MSAVAEVVAGLARLLAEHQVAAYRPDGVYAAGETALTDTVMPEQPDRVICLTVYAVEESPALTDCTFAVQVRTRAGTDPREAAALDEAVFAVLHGLRHLDLPTVRITLVHRVSAASLGADPVGRFERTSNYRICGHRPHPRLE
ncbi:minor capsid protein [Streptomyces spectabilis]|uniref:minor capsid protein n=1 Tax=Streptomyces spectabilis TaxID=68270 RepID=UPI0033D1F3A4